MRYDNNPLMNPERLSEAMIAGEALITEAEAILESDGVKNSPVVGLYKKARSIGNFRKLDPDDQAWW